MATGRIGTTPVLQVRWSKAPSAGTTSLSGLDDNSVSLVYSVGYEAVYRNGVLLSRTNDYTATDGTTVTLIDATIAGDIIEIFANQLVPLTDAISKGQFTAKAALLSATAASTPAVLTVGANNTVLTADSSTSTGLKWAAPSGGGLVHLNTTSFSAVSSQSINDVFSATYDYYKIIIVAYGSTAAGINMRLRVSGSDNSSSIYNYQRLEVNGTIEDGNRSTNQTSWATGEYGSDSNISSNMEISLFKPFEAVHTTMRSQSTSLANGVDALRIDYFDSVHKANTSFTGFTLLATAGNATGSVSVFGYAKA